MDNQRHPQQEQTGKHIVLTMFGSLGDLHPYVAIALELQSRGHRAVIATSGNYREKVERVGLEFHTVRPNGLLDIEQDWEFFQLLMASQRSIEYCICYLLMPHLRASYHDLMLAIQGADLLITHPLTFSGCLIAQKTGIPWILNVLAPSTFMSAYDCPNLSSSPGSSYEQALEWVANDAYVRRLRWKTRLWSAPVRQLRAELGLPPGSDPIFDQQYPPNQILALFSSVLATPQPDWPSPTAMTGFPFYDGHPEELLSPELTAFLEAGTPPIVFTLGSAVVWTAGNFYLEAIAAVQQLGCRAVLLMGPKMHQLVGQPLPSTIMAIDYAPHGQLFPRAGVIVHHGGVGTTGQALRSGRPMLVVPFAYDQSDNAARLVRLGVARAIACQPCTVDLLVTELKHLLVDPHYAIRASEVGRIVRAEAGVVRACDQIEAYVYRQSTSDVKRK